jgi:crossover junction endodeoxyribonuclease RuvC
MALILGIDPGSRKTGFGVVNAVEGRHEYVVSGVIRLVATSLPERLKVVFNSLVEIIEEYCPEEVAVEKVFMAKSADSALKLGQARGAAIAAVVSCDLPVAEYDTRKIKQSVVGNGAAEKRQVQHMVQCLLKLSSIPQEDAADALATALCHSHTQQSLLCMAQARHYRRGRMV